MDLFWLIPTGLVLIPLLLVLYVHISRRPSTPPSEPRVLVDKPSDEPLIDPATEARDWSGRPCGSYLEWLSGGK